MTIGGFLCDGFDRAWIWTDAEKYVDTDPSGECCKLTINALAPLIGAGAGTVAMIAEATDALQSVASFDAALIRLPKALRSAKGSAKYGLVGWSWQFGRIVGYLFDAATDFEPKLCAAARWPEAGELPSNIYDENDFIAPALAQMQELRRHHDRRYTGLSLVVAEVTRRGVRSARISDFSERVRACSKPRASMDFVGGMKPTDAAGDAPGVRVISMVGSATAGGAATAGGPS